MTDRYAFEVEEVHEKLIGKESITMIETLCVVALLTGRLNISRERRVAMPLISVTKKLAEYMQVTIE